MSEEQQRTSIGDCVDCKDEQVEGIKWKDGFRCMDCSSDAFAAAMDKHLRKEQRKAWSKITGKINGG